MRKILQQKREKGALTGFLLKVAVVVAAVYLMVSFVNGQIQVADKQRELDTVQAQLEQQNVKNAELSRLMESGDEDAYVERIAREKLGYARPNERVFVDISGR